MYRLVKTLLFWLPAELAHNLTLLALRFLSVFPALCRALRRGDERDPVLSQQLGPLFFPNPIGLAAGLDKDAQATEALFGFGFGFVEVGTITPRPQPGNPKPRLFRDPSRFALMNRMGFNNHGMEKAQARLSRQRFKPAPLGINIGKNATTSLEDAAKDYEAAAACLAPYGDYLVINVSSPNTKNLRELQQAGALLEIVEKVKARALGKPVFIKLAPELDEDALKAIVEVAARAGIFGLICTNTTAATMPTGEPGGLSGKPLSERSTALIRMAATASRGRLVIVGVGGIFDVEDAYKKLLAGASVLQVYSGFVYGGPSFPSALVRALRERILRDGFAHIGEVIGKDLAMNEAPGQSTRGAFSHATSRD